MLQVSAYRHPAVSSSKKREKYFSNGDFILPSVWVSRAIQENLQI